MGRRTKVLDRTAPTILKDNISWHYPFPSANTTPWQLEGTILALRKNGFTRLSCVQNKTEVTNAYKGEDLNGYRPVFEAHGIQVLFNFKKEDMKWTVHRPKARMLVLDKIFKKGFESPTISSARISSTCRRSSATSIRRRPAR